MDGRIGKALGIAVLLVALGERARAEDIHGLDYQVRPDCVPTSFERPYVCDVGPPRVMPPRSFWLALEKNEAMRAHVRRMGPPDLVEVQKVYVDAPWTTDEIRLYYHRYDRMFAFSRAYILDVAEATLMRYQGPIPADHRR